MWCLISSFSLFNWISKADKAKCIGWPVIVSKSESLCLPKGKILRIVDIRVEVWSVSDDVISCSGKFSKWLIQHETQRLSEHELLWQFLWSLYQIVYIHFLGLQGKGQLGKASGNWVSRVPASFPKEASINQSCSLKIAGHFWGYACLFQTWHSSESLSNITNVSNCVLL